MSRMYSLYVSEPSTLMYGNRNDIVVNPCYFMERRSQSTPGR